MDDSAAFLNLQRRRRSRDVNSFDRVAFLREHLNRCIPGVKLPDDVIAHADCGATNKGDFRRLPAAEKTALLQLIAWAGNRLREANGDELTQSDVAFLLHRIFRVRPKVVKLALSSPDPSAPAVLEAAPTVACAAPLVPLLVDRAELELLSDVVWNKTHDMRLWGTTGATLGRLVRLSAYLDWMLSQNPAPEGCHFVDGRVVAGADPEGAAEVSNATLAQATAGADALALLRALDTRTAN